MLQVGGIVVDSLTNSDCSFGKNGSQHCGPQCCELYCFLLLQQCSSLFVQQTEGLTSYISFILIKNLVKAVSKSGHHHIIVDRMTPLYVIQISYLICESVLAIASPTAVAD